VEDEKENERIKATEELDIWKEEQRQAAELVLLLFFCFDDI